MHSSAFWLAPRTQPLIVAHRGDSAHAPENTLAAFQKAVEAGADAVELDVQLTSDGEVVVFHDARLDRTTNRSGYITRQSFDKLRELSAGAWFGNEFKNERIPALDEVLTLLGPKIGINIELKITDGGARVSQLVERCVEIVQGHQAHGRVLFSSFHNSSIVHLKERYPEFTAGFLIHPLRHALRLPIRKAQDLGVQYLIFSSNILRKRHVQRAHDAGLEVMEYTVNTLQRLRRSLRFGVDAIITDDPTFLHSQLSNK